jgi:hypothetical protein
VKITVAILVLAAAMVFAHDLYHARWCALCRIPTRTTRS